MNIMVVDVAATKSGALTILEFYFENCAKDTENNYFFCISTPQIFDKGRVKVLRFPWVKKSWLHRLWFDHVTCRKIIKENNIDEIISLQNIAVPHTDLPQTVYLHQPLPFIQHKFGIFEDPKFWCYQNIISKSIISSLQKAKSVIVQTDWMKNAVIEQANVSPDKIAVECPEVDIDESIKFNEGKWNGDLFYPAMGHVYKNHKVIFEALEILEKEGAKVPTVTLTLTEEQLPKNCINLYEKMKEHIRLMGLIPRSEVLELMSRCTLVFPSYIETLGLPPVEARMIGAPVIASDCPFTHETLDGYDNAEFFDPFSPEELAEKIKKFIA